jgi:acetyl-CoA C-acetyltransferase
LSAGLPQSVPGTTVDRQCGSSQQAAHFAAQGVMAGVYDLAIAGGVEVMSLVPLQCAIDPALGFGSSRGADGFVERFGDLEVSQFVGAELIAEKWGLEREDMERFALESHRRADVARREGRFDAELAPLAGVAQDEGIRPGSTAEKLATLKTIRPGGRLTAATASQVSDGAAALLVASPRAVDELGLTPLARFHTFAVVGSDPVAMLTGPIPATEKALARSGLALDDIDLFEVNEAFASVVMAWAQELGAPLDRTNVNGGAIALGHPLGATGAKLMTTLVHELARSGGRYGLQVMCEGGGMANATIVERL